MRENRDFVVPVNILTTFAHAPFSWAARHTTVCLDLKTRNITMPSLPMLAEYLVYFVGHLFEIIYHDQPNTQFLVFSCNNIIRFQEILNNLWLCVHPSVPICKI